MVTLSQDTTFALFSYGKTRDTTVLRAGSYELVEEKAGVDSEKVAVLRRDDGTTVEVIVATHWGPVPAMANWTVTA